MEKLQDICETFFTKFWISVENIEIHQEEDSIYRVTLKTPDSHIIIWPHWKNLEHFWHILKLIFSKELERFIHLHLEVNDYLQEKDAKLYKFLDSKMLQVQSKWKELVLPQFSAYERKKVHSYVAEKKWNIYTESRWEWSERRIYLCIKHNRMTIDLDWDDI